ncbi:MAG: hypothetical protein ACLVCH_12930 [Roseburia inulinivorans]
MQMLELNEITAADGTAEKMQKVIRQFEQGKLDVFRGDYVGADPDDPDDTYDLNQGYTENEFASAPSFRYVLKRCDPDRRIGDCEGKSPADAEHIVFAGQFIFFL